LDLASLVEKWIEAHVEVNARGIFWILVLGGAVFLYLAFSRRRPV